MTKKHFEIITIILVVIFLFSVDPVYAGPGGTVVKALFKTWWGKLLMILLAIILLPLIIYSRIIEFIKVRQTKKELLKIGLNNNEFSWLNMEKNISNIFTRTYLAWSNEDMSEVKNYVNHWYWQNQQLAHLEKWKKQGLKNICDVKKITHIKPLLFVHRNHGQEHEDSMVIISIEAKMKDYLQNVNSGKVVEGSKRYKEVETVWSLTMENGQWKVSDIEAGSMSLAYAKLVKDLPDIETTLASDSRA